MQTDHPKRLSIFQFAPPRSILSRSARGPHTRIEIERLETRCYLSAPRAIAPFEADFLHIPADSDAALPGTPQPLNQRAAAGSFLDLGGGLVVFLTNEAAQRRDLNGDGDKFDDVLQSFNAATGVGHNSGMQAIAGTIIDLGGRPCGVGGLDCELVRRPCQPFHGPGANVSDGLVAFLTDESAQGRRLNTDRDRFDDVLQVFNAVTGEVRSSRQQAIANSVCDLGDGRIGFATEEAAQNRSLNGDRDKFDNVFQVFDAVANVVQNSFQQIVDDSLLDLGGGLVAFLTDESAQGRDLNADGDKQDNVLQSFDSVVGVVRNSGSQAVAGSPQDIEGGFVAFVTYEADQDRRLNADGDKQDSVLQIFDAASGIVQNTGQAVA